MGTVSPEFENAIRIPSWDVWVNWLLALAMIACAIYIIMNPGTRISISPGIGGVKCVSDYNYHVDKFCLFYENYTYQWIIIDETKNATSNYSESMEKRLITFPSRNIK
jgi:hypothetical protein